MPRGATTPFLVAAAQVAPVFLDQAATLEKACEWIVDAGAAGARLVVFPASFIPASPAWLPHAPALAAAQQHELQAALVAQSVQVPGEVTHRLGRMARRAQTYVMIGVSERAGEMHAAPLYHTLLTFDAHGELLSAHRQGLLAEQERAAWQAGPGHRLPVFDTPLGRLAGLPREECSRPLVRQALYAWGVQLLAVTGWAPDELWLASLRHIAQQGATFVVGCGMPLRPADIPAPYAFEQPFDGAGEWLSEGNSAIVGPDGAFLAGPLCAQEGLLLAEIDLTRTRTPAAQPEQAAHEGFLLEINRGMPASPAAEGEGEGRSSQTRGL